MSRCIRTRGRRAVRLAVVLAVLVAWGPRAARADDEAAWATWRAGIERLFLEGRLEEIDQAMPAAPSTAQAWPRLLRDLWWRRPSGAVPLPTAPAVDTLLARRLAWLQGGGVAPHPLPEGPEIDPWPVLTALVRDRQRRLSAGAIEDRVAAPELNALSIEDTYTSTILLQGLQKLDAYTAELAAASPEAWERSAAAAQRTRRWAFVLLAGLLLAAGLLGRRARPVS